LPISSLVCYVATPTSTIEALIYAPAPRLSYLDDPETAITWDAATKLR